MSDRRISDLTAAELMVRLAQYAERAERARAQQRTAGNAASGRTLEAGRLARHYQALADDYAHLLRLATGE